MAGRGWGKRSRAGAVEGLGVRHVGAAYCKLQVGCKCRYEWVWVVKGA